MHVADKPRERNPRPVRKEDGPSRASGRSRIPPGPPNRPQEPLDSTGHGQRTTRGGPRSQTIGGRRNGQRGPTAADAEDAEGEEGRGDDGVENDQEPDALAERYERKLKRC